MIRRGIINNRIISIGILCLLVFGGFVSFITFESDVVSAVTIYVGSGAGNNSVTINGGIALTNPGDTVYVYSGTYNENVVVDKTINLTGEDREITIIDGGGSEDAVLIIANWVNITGFTMTNGGNNLHDAGIEIEPDFNFNTIFNNNISSNKRPGICLWDSSNNTITDNNISNNGYGIFLPGSSNNTITNNNISNNGYGIYLPGSSSNNNITNNNISNNGAGICLIDSSNNNISNNNFLNNVFDSENGNILDKSSNTILTGNNFINDGILITGDQLSHFNSHNISTSNIVNGKPLYYFKDSVNINIDGIPVGQLILANCSGFNVRNLQISDTSAGIEIAFSTDIIITNNNVSSNSRYGIFLRLSSYINITNTTVFSNGDVGGDCGIFLEDALNNYIGNNHLLFNNGYGIWLRWSLNNTIINNNISNNFENGIRLWAFSSNNTIINNIVSSNLKNGIDLGSESNNNSITNNYISDNLRGIIIWASSNDNTIINNIVLSNSLGIALWSPSSPPSFNNMVYHNNIINNANQSYDNTNNGNQWDNGYPEGGNYWSDFDEASEGAYDDYRGPNQDEPISGDGIVDNGIIGGGGRNPYMIDSDSQDNYPLINPLDNWPPIITNLQPPNGSTTNDNTSTISADYTDPSGINVSSVVLIVDGIDVTLSASVTASGVNYIPGMALSDGIHTVYLEVRDNVGYLATATWTFTVDTSPPIITNLQPPDASTTNDNTPIISADYSDPLGIDLSSILLEVDSIDVTSFTVVTVSGMNYTPGTALPDGAHTVYLEVKDNVGNLATAMWSFTVDATPPIITNLQPLDSSITNDNTPMIRANYNDLSGINLSSVLLEVDGMDVTPSAMVTVSNVSFIPGTVLLDGVHTVYLGVKDIYGNLATASWSFTVDATPPIITNLQPPDLSITNNSMPTISADYSDLSSINVSSVVLKVDGIDVTSSATVTASGVSYLPGAALSDSTHTVYLEVKDNVDNLASVTWSFTVDSTPPIITNLQPPDGSIINLDIPIISADYGDLSGINVSSVLLEVDGFDVTSFVTVTGSGVSYIPGIPLSDGIHTIYLEVKDIYGNLATESWSFTIDTSPPLTTISPNNYNVKLGSLFTLTVTDGVTGSGVNYTQYKIDEGPWIDYSVPFSIDSYGYHNITYRSVDNLGNIENENILSIYVPEIPITTIIVGSPQYGTIPKYVNYSTQFSFSVIDYSGLGYDTYYYIDSAPPILYYGPFTVLAEGAHTISYYSVDNLGNIEDTKQIEIIVDNTPPTTTIAIGDPHYVSGDIWVTSATGFTLSTTDAGQIPVGVDFTNYRIWNGAWSEWSVYENGFTLGVNDGIRYVEFYSVDLLGNTESINNRTFIVDNTPPTTTILFEGPSYRKNLEDILNVTSETTFVFSVFNGGMAPVGIDFTEYRIWNNGTWSDRLKYSNGFNLDSGNDTRYIEWYSTDKLGNKEITNNLTVFVDNIPPTTEYILQLESDNSEARISLISSDIGSGSAFTKYKIDNLTWSIYSNTLVINEPGLHTVYFRSEDNLENTEEQRELTVLIEEPEQSKPPTDIEKDTNFKPLIAFLFAIILLVVGTFVSMKKPLKKVKENKMSTWLLVVLPFVVAEVATGIISFFTGILSVPPLFGLGMIVDSTILIAGLIVFILMYKKQK
jgi:parallel beta-helix repeat protein